LVSLPEEDQVRLGVIADWKHGPHRLTYRQTERTFGLVAAALAGGEPGGLPSRALQAICDDLLEASIPDDLKDASTSLAVDWSDLETFSRPPAPRPPKAGPAPTPRPPGGTARTTWPAPRTSCSSATTCRLPSWRRTSRDRPSPSSPAAPRSRRAATTPSPSSSPS